MDTDCTHRLIRVGFATKKYLCMTDCLFMLIHIGSMLVARDVV